MATNKQLAKKQEELDDIKWCDSEQAGNDACGAYEYCVMCDKQATYPCARAYYAFNKAGQQSPEYRANVELSAIAQKLRALRMAKNLSIEQAAKLCKVLPQRLFEFENDKDKPSEDTLARILSVLERR